MKPKPDLQFKKNSHAAKINTQHKISHSDIQLLFESYFHVNEIQRKSLMATQS
jgi:hypothetical protein